MTTHNKYSALVDVLFVVAFITVVLCVTAIVLVNTLQHAENVKSDNAVLEGLLSPYGHCRVVYTRPENGKRDTRVVLICSKQFRESE